MTVHYYPAASFGHGMSNSLAFKQGKIYGPCLEFQQTLKGRHASSKQAHALWKK